MPFKPIDAHLPTFNPFERFGREWALLTAGDSDAVNTMTVSWGVLGRLNGRDEDKIARVGFTPVELDGDFAFEEAELVLACRVLYADEIDPELFWDASCDERNYPEHDYHTVYVGEVERGYVRVRDAGKGAA